MSLRIIIPATWLTLICSSLGSDVIRQQQIPLKAGWNAVHLEVTPLAKTPNEVFNDVPIDICARYFRADGSTQFIQNPDELDWKKEEWGVWYAPNREDAFLTNLHALSGGHCYLIHAKSDHLWTFSGKVMEYDPKWRKGSFNLAGFSINADAPPTFGQLFSGAGEDLGQSIYRLQDDRWVKVLNPSNTYARPGEAFWVKCDGMTNYQGPLELEMPGAGIVDFGTLTETVDIKWTKHLPGPLTVTTVSAAGGTAKLPLKWVERDLSTLRNVYHTLDSLELTSDTGGGKLTLQIRRDEMVNDKESCLLKFTDSSGVVVWVPIAASKSAE